MLNKCDDGDDDDDDDGGCLKISVNSLTTAFSRGRHTSLLLHLPVSELITFSKCFSDDLND